MPAKITAPTITHTKIIIASLSTSNAGLAGAEQV